MGEKKASRVEGKTHYGPMRKLGGLSPKTSALKKNKREEMGKRKGSRLSHFDQGQQS